MTRALFVESIRLVVIALFAATVLAWAHILPVMWGG